MTAQLHLPSLSALEHGAFVADARAWLHALIEVCHSARERLDVCTFVFAGDRVGRAAAAALAEAVRALPRMLHAKVVIADDALALCGSVNRMRAACS